ncbi:MAG: hypothetical protein AMJ92_00010 [candidate division Zixibacteria bacterium SM23_81]|nr:MAG: hypothetical protein AMJ92_00010 [candidate division Zixibacteria bacterium SM23_81]
MKNNIKEAYDRKLREVAEDYKSRGYEVFIEPSPSDLPDFMAGFRPDLVARGPKDSVVVEIKIGTSIAASEQFRELARRIQQNPGWRFSLVVVDTRQEEVTPTTEDLINQEDIEKRMDQADQLISSKMYDNALLLLWTSVEALLRHFAIREGLPLDRLPTSALIKELYSQGVISREDLGIAQKALTARNSVFHGFQSSELKVYIKDIAQFARRLLSELKYGKN